MNTQRKKQSAPLSEEQQKKIANNVDEALFTLWISRILTAPDAQSLLNT